jgi:hypothetical protein
MDDAVSARIAENNVAFREANERIRERAGEYEPEMDRIPFLCECPRPECVEVVPLTLAQYRDLRSNAKHFMTAVGHESAEKPVGHIVSRPQGYVVVEKDVSAVDGPG